ncbi:ComEC/Rec2 family competence protein [Patescibacteria group bacterium]
MNKFAKYRRYIFGISFVFIIIFWIDFSKINHGLLKISIFDVGQGDAILIQTPNNQQILIDGGPSKSIIDKLGDELPFWDRNIDMLISTHPHADHLSGLLEVTDRYSIDQIMTLDIDYDSGEFEAWKDYLDEFSGDIIYANFGQEIQADDFVMKIIFPSKEYLQIKQDNINNLSIILKIQYNDFSMLFTGDAECEEQIQILDQDINIDVLKVPHQGSRDAGCEEFLKKTSPEKAIISVAQDNQFGHPHTEHLELLHKLIPDRPDQEIYRTDKNGDIHIYSDKNKYWIETDK